MFSSKLTDAWVLEPALTNMRASVVELSSCDTSQITFCKTFSVLEFPCHSRVTLLYVTLSALMEPTSSSHWTRDENSNLGAERGCRNVFGSCGRGEKIAPSLKNSQKYTTRLTHTHALPVVSLPKRERRNENFNNNLKTSKLITVSLLPHHSPGANGEATLPFTK